MLFIDLISHYKNKLKRKGGANPIGICKKNMRKTYILEDLDCAHCAALIEEKVGKLDGVTKSTVTLLTQKLVVEVEDDKAAGLLKEITKIVKKHEPDVEVIEK